MKFGLQRVQYMPAELEPYTLYVSEEFDIAMHLCACGCGSKVRTPLGATEWSFTETDGGPSLSPSVGNWQQPCQSHYWIRRGLIQWAPKWAPEEIAEGRRQEEERRHEYYNDLEQKRTGILRRFWNWVMKLFKQ